MAINPGNDPTDNGGGGMPGINILPNLNLPPSVVTGLLVVAVAFILWHFFLRGMLASGGRKRRR